MSPFGFPAPQGSSPPRRLPTVTDRDPAKRRSHPLVVVTPTEGPNGGSTTRAKCYLGRPDNFVEQREYRSSVARAHGFVPKPMRRIVVMGEFVGRRNHCA